jgi:hypothetical protein
MFNELIEMANKFPLYDEKIINCLVKIREKIDEDKKIEKKDALNDFNDLCGDWIYYAKLINYTENILIHFSEHKRKNISEKIDEYRSELSIIHKNAIEAGKKIPNL